MIGVIVIVLYALNVTFWFLVLIPLRLLRFIPIKAWQKQCNKMMNGIPACWADVNQLIDGLKPKIEWDIEGVELLKKNEWYLVICNHQSWTDILVLQRIFKHKIPAPKFFIKKQLLWSLPMVGLGAWLLNYPFMNRYGKEFLAKHPELKGKDIEETKRACEKFKNDPTTVANFVEGTRLTAEKQKRQESPYQYLLRPKSTGIAFALAALNEHFHKILNVTIAYPNTTINMWDFFCGRVKKIVVRIELLPITPNLIGDFENDRNFRIYFQKWINELWKKKDALLKALNEK